MDDHRDNVVALPDCAWVGGKQPSYQEVLRGAIGHLDELSSRLDKLAPHVTWSARQWMIASTPFRMRLIGARKRLRELTACRPAPGQTDVYWLLKLQDASIEA